MKVNSKSERRKRVAARCPLSSSVPSSQPTSYYAIVAAPPVKRPTAAPKTLIIRQLQTSALKASKTLYIKKSVYRIGNIDAVYEASDLQQYIESLGVRVISCFERRNVMTDNKTFRVCIMDVDRDKLLSSENWSIGISIQRWVFRPKPEVDEEEEVDDGDSPGAPPPANKKSRADDTTDDGAAAVGEVGGTTESAMLVGGVEDGGGGEGK